MANELVTSPGNACTLYELEDNLEALANCIALAEDESARLRLAIGRLPVDQREILVLREFEDMSYRQIASITGCPIGTVMSRLSRARDQLALIVRGEPGASS